MGTIAAVVLAAGASTRLGRPKQLLVVGERSLVRGAVHHARSSCADRVVVILGAYADAIAPVLEEMNVDVVLNEQWPEGIASSIRCGLAWAEAQSCTAVLVLVGDQPGLNAAHLDRLIAIHRAGAPLVASAYAGVLGVPALFDSASFSALRSLHGDQGARRILRDARGVVAVEWEPGAIDLDTPEDFARVTRGVGAQ